MQQLQITVWLYGLALRALSCRPFCVSFGGMADETDPTQYFRAMEEKERALAAQYERDRQHRTETLAELSKCLMDRESEYRRLMLEAQQKERRFVDLLENRAAWEPAGERSALDADKRCPLRVATRGIPAEPPLPSAPGPAGSCWLFQRLTSWPGPPP